MRSMILPSQKVINATIDARLMVEYDPTLSTNEVIQSAAKQNSANLSQVQEWTSIKAVCKKH